MIGTHKMKCNVIADAMPDYDSNSIAQYGIQATLPKPQGQNSSKVEDVVIKLERTNNVMHRCYVRLNLLINHNKN